MENGQDLKIQWYPGHMTKTRRMIVDQLKNVDAVCELLDARIPVSSRNPDVDELTAGKPRLVVLNRADQADPVVTKQWAAYFRDKGYAVLECSAKDGGGVDRFPAAVRTLLADKLRAYAEKGQVGRTVRVMILGIPNVGKSTFINRVAKRKTAKTEDRPGVTRAKQWVPIDRGAAGYAGYSVAQVRGSKRRAESGLYRRGAGRGNGYRGAGLQSDALSRGALLRGTGGTL